MSDLVEIYQDNIKTIFTRVGKLLDNLSSQSSDKSENTIIEAENSIKEAERIVKNMEINLMTSGDSNQGIILRNFKNGLDQYKKKIKSAKENYNTQQKLETLLISDKENQKEKLINNEEIAWGQFDKLEKAKRASYEMESISIDVAKELHGHTEKMKGVKGKLNDINGEISSSNSLISRMLRREYRNKIVLLMFLVAMVLIFLAIVYMKFFGKDSAPKAPGVSEAESVDASQKRFLDDQK